MASYTAIISEEYPSTIDCEVDGALVFMDFAAFVGADVGKKVGMKEVGEVLVGFDEGLWLGGVVGDRVYDGFIDCTS